MTKPARTPLTIACPACGAGASVDQANKVRQTEVDRALRVVCRVRACQCGRKFTTTELPSEELADLRRRAHLYERLVAKGGARG